MVNLKGIYLKFDNNSKNIITNVFGSFIVKGFSLVVGFLTLPSYMSFFSNDNLLGFWFTLLTVLMWLLNFDFGIGNGLRNRLVTLLVLNDKIAIKKSISSSYIYVTLVSTLLLLIFISFGKFINWNSFFNIPTDYISVENLRITVFIVIGSILLQLVLRLITSILFALQISYLPNLLTLLSNLLLLIIVNLYNFMNMNDNIILLAWSYLLCVNLPLLLTTLYIFLTKLKNYRPNLKYFDHIVAKDILKFGFVFLWLSFMSLLIQNTNELLISKLINAAAVVEYSIYQKVFGSIASIFALSLVPIWSAVTKAQAEEKFNWIIKLYKVLLVICFFGLILLLIFIPFLQNIFDLWLKGNSTNVNIYFALIFAFFNAINIWAGTLTTLSNGLGVLKLEVIWLTFGAIINFPLAIYLSSIYDTFIVIVLANIISLLPFCIIQTIFLFKYLKVSGLNSPNNSKINSVN